MRGRGGAEAGIRAGQRRPRFASSNAPARDLRKVHLVLTGRCNLRCSYCYQNRKPARRMSWETLREAVDLAAASRADDVRLLFSGGEPLLELPLIRRAVEYARRVRSNGKSFRPALITNGTLLRPEVASYLVGAGFEVLLSFDGTPTAQTLRGRGTFAVLDRRLEELRRDQPAFLRRSLTVGITLTPSAVGGLADAIHYLTGRGVRRITVSPVIAANPDWSAVGYRKLGVQFERIVDLSVGLHGVSGEIPFAGFRSSSKARALRNGNHASNGSGRVQDSNGRAMCGAGHGEEITVAPDGEVAGCPTWLESLQEFPGDLLQPRLGPLRLGNIGSAGFMARLASLPDAVVAIDMFNQREKKHSSYGLCAECRYLHDCSVCPIAIGHISGNRDPHRIPDFHCAYNRISLAAREEFQRQVAGAGRPRREGVEP